MITPLEAYRLWAPTWDADPSAIVALESRTLSPWLTELRGRKVFDFSCGTGRWLSLGAGFGMDLCREMLLEAQRKPRLAGRLVQADICHLPLADRSLELALCALSLGHVSDPESAIAELARVVRPGGSLLLSDFHPDAIHRGWKRTFRSGGQSYEIESSPYTKQLLVEWAAKAGLSLEDIAEPCFGEPEREIFERAGKRELFEQVNGVPAVLVARWKRP